MNLQNNAGFTAVMLASLTAPDGPGGMEVVRKIMELGNINIRSNQVTCLRGQRMTNSHKTASSTPSSLCRLFSSFQSSQWNIATNPTILILTKHLCKEECNLKYMGF